MTTDGRRAYFGTAIRDSTADTLKACSITMLAARDAIPCREVNSSRWARYWRKDSQQRVASCSFALLLAHVCISAMKHTCHHISQEYCFLTACQLQLKQAGSALFLMLPILF